MCEPLMDFALEPDLDEAFPLPNLDDFDLSELSCDETPSPTTSSSECSPFGSPASLDIPLDSPSSSSSLSPDSTCTSPTFSRQDSEGSTVSSCPRSSKHRAKCQVPQCIKKEHVSILRRNERERNRVKLVSDGFATLRRHIPTTPVNKKLSKVETLRTAIEYIKHLQKVLNESNRIERERRLLRQMGWLQKAYKLQSQSRVSMGQQNQINALLMDLPEIAPYPRQLPLQPVSGLGNPMGLLNFLGSMG